MNDKFNNAAIPFAIATPSTQFQGGGGEEKDDWQQQQQTHNAVAVGTISHDLSQLKVTQESIKCMGHDKNNLPPLVASASATDVKLSNNGYQPFSKDQTLELRDMGYTKGLIESMENSRSQVSLRIWIIDNSGSMLGNDGQQVKQSPKDNTVFKVIPCSRWVELRDTVNYHMRLAGIIKAPTSFRFLNDPGVRVGPQQFGVGERGNENYAINEEVQIGKNIMDNLEPSGLTPLCQHINEIYEEICSNRSYLESNGKSVSVVIATDGLPTDSNGDETLAEQANLVNILKRFENLPVWIVIRLCTDDENVVTFYNNLDSQLELPLEVLDDFVSEAKEVHAVNPWLNYALPLHLCREMGMANLRSFDFLDERKFHLTEIRDFVSILFGNEATKDAPDPNIDVNKYCQFLEKKVFKIGKENKIWDPVSQKRKEWVVVKKLKKYRFGFIPAF